MDLLNPQDFFKANYVHQIRQTISAYSDSLLVVGEALQNAIDAVCLNTEIKKGEIGLNINFDTDTIEVTDNGVGFPRDSKLLFLGGSEKKSGKSPTMGKIGVGIKVTLFSSSEFIIKSNPANETPWHIEINNADQFESLSSLKINDPLPEDKSPLTNFGTKLSYRLGKNGEDENYLDLFVQEIQNKCLPKGVDKAFGKTLSTYGNSNYPSSFACLLASFLRRYTYVGDVLNQLGGKTIYPDDGIEINVKITCSNPKDRFGKDFGKLFSDKKVQEFKIDPTYLLVEESTSWVPNHIKSPIMFDDKLGDGGSNLDQTANGFNQLLLTDKDEYKSLLVNKRGNLPPNIADHERKLFDKINGIIITIGRIPDFDLFLPAGSRRVISCNGVITDHDIDVTSGRNQEYVRCFDLVIDVDGTLNYGKNQLTNMHLVKSVRDFINDAYSRVIQNAAGNFVGKTASPTDDDDEIYVKKEDLNLDHSTFKKVPYDENDVISLFFELCGKGLFKDYEVYGLSQKSLYDCKAVIKRPCDNDSVFSPIDDSKLSNVEFKVHVSSLIKDFDRRQKFPRELQLLIAWDIGEYDSKYYRVYDIEHSASYNTSPSQVYPNVSKFIQDSKEGAEVQIILLSEIIEKIKKGDKVE